MSRSREDKQTMMEMHEAGVSYAEIGRRFGITGHAVALSIKRLRRKIAVEKMLPDEIGCLNARVKNALWFMGITSRAEARQIPLDTFARRPNFGKKSLRELQAWINEEPS